MERLRRVNEKIISRYNLDRFAVQQICKDLTTNKRPDAKDLTYEYRIGEQWVSGPPTQKPTGKRAILEQYDFDASVDIYLAWDEILKRKQFGTERPEAVLERLGSGWYNAPVAPLFLFVPWGVRPEGKPKYEQRVIKMIADFRDAIQAKNIRTEVFFMPADVYATEINRQVDPRKVAAYFSEMKKIALSKRFVVKPWSKIRSENMEVYQNRSAELTPDRIREILGVGKVWEAFDTAKRRSGYTSQAGIERAAFAYLRERIIEAEIVEAVYKPIKVSAVAKNKDNGVDRDLPRVYIIPERFQFPWLIK